MNIILLSGGSGKRLWPLSNDVRSKQFLKLFPGPDGEYESMVQRAYRQIRTPPCATSWGGTLTSPWSPAAETPSPLSRWPLPICTMSRAYRRRKAWWSARWTPM